MALAGLLGALLVLAGCASGPNRAPIEDSDIVPGHIAINRVMRGAPDWEPPAGYLETLRTQGRVVVRITPARVSGVVNRG